MPLVQIAKEKLKKVTTVLLVQEEKKIAKNAKAKYAKVAMMR
jgi:hypothetical protein